MKDALTLPMLSIIALTELRRIATTRTADVPGIGPIFLAPVHTDPFWRVETQHPDIRRAAVYFRLVDMRHLFDEPISYPLLERLEAHIRSSLYVLVPQLHIVDGSRFVSLPYGSVPPPAFTAHDNDVAILLNLDTIRQQLWLSAAVTPPKREAGKPDHECSTSSSAASTTRGSGSRSRAHSAGADGTPSP